MLWIARTSCSHFRRSSGVIAITVLARPCSSEALLVSPNTLTAPSGDIVATLDISDVYPWDKCGYIKSVYGTGRIDRLELPNIPVREMRGKNAAFPARPSKAWKLAGWIGS